MKRNYQRELEKIIEKTIDQGESPTLLLHSCCAPCSSYVLEYLNRYFQITVLFYNPNISPQAEYEKRKAELKRLIGQLPAVQKINMLDCDYDPAPFWDMAKGLEALPEGGARCRRCYELRLRAAAEAARQGGYEYFTSTLSISPLKNAEVLNEIGERLAGEYGVSHLPSDFKKKEGYKRSIELSKEYGLYRQNYCGCVFSKPLQSE